MYNTKHMDQPTKSNDTPKTPLVADELQQLYPTPKTYDEKLAERAEIQDLHRTWHTHHPRLLILSIVCGIMLGVAAIGATASSLVMTAPLLGVPLTVLMLVAWYFSLRAGVAKIRDTIDTNPNF